MKKPEDVALEKTKIALMMLPNTIFFTTILFSLVQSWNKEIETAGVNGTNLIINPVWFLSLTKKERIGLIVHEIMHVALNHMTRCGDRNQYIYNVAGDYVINLELNSAQYTLPPNGLYDRKYVNMTTDQVYTLIYDDAQNNPNSSFGANSSAIPGGQDIQYPKNSKELKATAKDIADIVLRATIQSQAANETPGNISGEINKQLQSIINPKLPWNVILQNYMQNFIKENFTWRRPNKKFMPKYYLPTAYSEAICNIAVAVDSSGSVSNSEFSYFIVEIASIQQTLKPDKITLIDFDTQINDIQEITESTDCMKDLKFLGGGGTELTEVLQWAQKNNPDVLLIFTDGDFYMPSKQYYPSCPIIWLIHSNEQFKAPFGEIIHYSISRN